MVAQVDVGLEARNTLACNPGALQTADQLFTLAGEHWAGNHFNAANFNAAGLCWVHRANAFAESCDANVSTILSEQAVRIRAGIESQEWVDDAANAAAAPRHPRRRSPRCSSLQSYRDAAFDDWHVRLLQDVAAHVSLALANADHFAQAQSERARLEALHVLEMGVAGASDESQIADAVFAAVSDYTDASHMVLAYLDAAGNVGRVQRRRRRLRDSIRSQTD